MGGAPRDRQADRRSGRRLFGLLRYSFGVIREAAPREFAVSAVLQLVQGAATGVQVLVVRNVLAAILTGSPHQGYLPAIEQIALLVALQTVTGMIGIYTAMQQQLIGELVQRHASRRVTDVSTAVRLVDFDTPDFHDLMQRAQQTAAVRPLQVTGAVLTLVQGLLALAGIVVALVILSPLLLAVSLVGFLPLWLATARVSRAVHQFMHEMTPNDRRRGYVLALLTSRDMAKEVRVFGLGPYLRGLLERLSQERIDRLRQHLRRRAWLSLAASGGSAATGGIAFATLAWLIATGRIGLASAAAAAMATLQIRGQLQGVATAGGQLYESSLFVEDLQTFLDLLPGLGAAKRAAPAPAGFRRIQVRDVHFTYPAATPPRPASNGVWSGGRGGPARRHALRGVSMEIRRGEVVALVGENGSGKTTLAKLISGLYTPDAGSVCWDGTDTRAVDPNSLCEQVTVIFQDYVRYWLTARENIGMGRVARMGDEDAIREAARQAGADGFIEAWPEGYEAPLGPMFDGGKDLSVGQWQRMALARAFFRDAPLVILDEPTASVDPRAEADLFARMRRLFAGRTVLLISHRFSSVRSADRIYVMREGEVVEQGSHDGLMAERGLYAELFALQAAAYH